MNVGSLTIEIAANVARLQKDMDDTKRIVGGAMRDVEKYVGYAKSALIGLTGVASVAGFASMVNGAIEAKARLYDLSLQTGINVQALSALGTVAKYSNTDLTEVAAASNKLSKALFTQNEDSKGAAQAIKALGLNFDQFKQLAPDEQMRQVAVAMSNFQDGAGKAAGAMLLFGKAGAQLLPFLTELAERQDIVGKETVESAKMAKQYEDNLVTLRRASEAWKKQIATELLPTLVAFTSQMAEAKTVGEKFAAIWGNIKENTGFGKFDIDRKSLEQLNLQITLAGAKYRDLAEAQQKEPFNRGIAEAAQRAKVDLDQLMAKAAAASQAMKTAAVGMDKIGGGRGVVNPALVDPRAKLELDVKPKGDIAKERDDYTALIKSIQEKISEQQADLEVTGKLTEGQKLLAKYLADVDGGYIKLTVSQEVAVRGSLEQLVSIEKLNKARDEELKWMKQAAEENARTIENMQQQQDAYAQQAADAEDQLRIYGLTADEVRGIEVARLRDAAATLRQRAAQADGAWLSDVAQLYRDQAAAIERTADARTRLADLEQRDRNSPMSGMDRAVKEYLDNVKRAGDETYGAVGRALGGLEDLGTDLITKGRGDVRAWVDMVIGEITRLDVVRPLIANLFGGVNGGGGGGVLGGLLSAVGGFLFGSAGMTIDPNGIGVLTGGSDLSGTGDLIRGRRAAGGPVSKGGLWEINENGTEVLSQGGKDYLMLGGPNGRVKTSATVQTSEKSQPIVVQNHFVIQGTTDRRSQAQLAQAAGEGVQRALARNA